MTKPSGSKKILEQKDVFANQKRKKTTVGPKTESWFINGWPLILLAISAILVLQARLKLLAIPMERDEAGFAYIGHWLIKGRSLYVDMVDNKLPGLYSIYGLITSMFGYNATGVHIGLMLANILSGLFFYLLLRDQFNRIVAAIATAFLLVLLAGPNVLGFAAHATQLLLPFGLAGFYVFWRGIMTGRKTLFLLSGLLLGFAFIIKQQSIVFGMLAAIMWWPLRLFWNKKEDQKNPIPEFIMLGIGGLLPLILVVAYFKMTGRLDELLFWAVRQPSRMSDTFINTRLELFSHFVPIVTKHTEPLWLAGFLGFVFIFLSRFRNGTILFAFLLTLLGLGSVVIGAAFYQHYFVLALPGIALLAATLIYWISIKLNKAGVWISAGLCVLLLLWPIAGEREYFFKPDYDKIHQQLYAINMFPELERIGKALAKRVPEGSRIGVMGSEPEVLVAADREGCSKHLFMYPILSDPLLSPPMQQEYLREMQACMPDYIVWNVGVLSWTRGYDTMQMFENLMQWVEQNYTTTGLAEFRQDGPGEIVWDGAVQHFQSQNQFKVYIFEKKK